jgi:[acyl-carrier-protein] S-malonyltransferase
MIGARDRLRSAIADADPRDTEVPVVSNVDALPHQLGKEWASLLSAQLSSPVRWKHVLLELVDRRVTEFIELGPGGVLTGMAKRTATGARTLSVSTPEDLDKLIEFVRLEVPSRATGVEGEHLFASERLVVSPAAGIFTPASVVTDGSAIDVGTVIGHVGSHEVRSPFAGILQSYIAVATERVTARQPIAWLRTN